MKVLTRANETAAVAGYASVRGIVLFVIQSQTLVGARKGRRTS